MSEINERASTSLPTWAIRSAKKTKYKKENLKDRQQEETRAMLCFASTEKFYSHPEWKLFRVEMLRSLGSKCMACGATSESVPIHVDHIRPRSKFPERSFDEENIQILCETCNMGKSDKMDLKFRASKLPFTIPELAPYLPDLPDAINAVRSASIQLKMLLENLNLDDKDGLCLFGFGRQERKTLISRLFVLVGATHRAGNFLSNKSAAFEATKTD